MTTLQDFTTEAKPNWCPGCGDYQIWIALKQALVELDIPPHDVLLVSGIGCSSKAPYWIKTYGFNGIHGRPLPVAQAAKLANHKLTVIAISGDGDGYGEGGNHFLHAMRRNVDITYLVFNNHVYGLTKGQTSPTSDEGFHTKITPHGAIEKPLNPLATAVASHCSFISRAFAGFKEDILYMKELIKQAIQHKGFALVDILQPCVSFNHINTYQFYRERIYRLEGEGHDVHDKAAAMAKSQEWGEKIPLGVFYKQERGTYRDKLPQIKDTPLVFHDIHNTRVLPLMKRYL